MDKITEWKSACEHGTADTVCTLCAGALHPVLGATVRHLEALLTNKQHVEVSAAQALQLSLETDDLFEEVRRTLDHLSKIEERAGATRDVAEDELLDVGIIASDTEALMMRFARIVPDIRNHVVTTGVRQTAL